MNAEMLDLGLVFESRVIHKSAIDVGFHNGTQENIMNKGELVAAIADSAGVSQKDAGACVDALFETIAAQVSAGNEVSITGWLKAQKANTSARVGRNPQTGATIQVPAGTRTKLTVGSKLKAAGKAS
jgi:DNA-binding protein HU-beta